MILAMIICAAIFVITCVDLCGIRTKGTPYAEKIVSYIFKHMQQ